MHGPDEVYNLIAVTTEDHFRLHVCFHDCLDRCIEDLISKSEADLNSLLNYLIKAKHAVNVIKHFRKLEEKADLHKCIIEASAEEEQLSFKNALLKVI
jgi:hypothetical protein